MSEIFELVLRAQAGDRTAFGELTERFQPTVFALALARLRNVAEAQELAQDVFLHAMRKLPQLRDAACFAGWLRQITVRMAINKATRGGAFRHAEGEALEGVEAAGPTPLESLERKEQAAQLHECLQHLKDLDRQTLEAFYLHGHSLKRMSRDFQTPVGTIKRRLHVARNRLRKHLDRARGEELVGA
jgi:RNA polymerase sigma-70 factor (ECF subfamily)